LARIAPDALAALCAEVFGLDLDRERLEVLAPQLEVVLAEIKRSRELDLAAVSPAVVFDPLCVYPPGENDG
jgi:hypothetical protein